MQAAPGQEPIQNVQTVQYIPQQAMQQPVMVVAGGGGGGPNTLVAYLL